MNGAQRFLRIAEVQLIKSDTTQKKQTHTLHGEEPRQEATEESLITPDSLRQLSFQYMEDGFPIVDLDGVHVDVNPALCRMTGFSAQELIGVHPLHTYLPEEHLEQVGAAFAKSLDGEHAQIELTFQRKNGERFPVIVHPFAIRDTDGKVLHYAATVVDMTQQLAMKASLREVESRFHALFENAGDGIVILEGDKAIDCNERVLELYHISRDQLFSLSDFSLSPGLQPNGKSSAEYIAEKIELCLAGKPQTFEWLGVTFDGTLIETEVTLTTIMNDGKLYTQSIIRDITKRKQMENALRFSEVRFRTLFENAGDAISIMKDYQIIECNRKLMEMYGFSRDDMFSSVTFDFFPPIQPNGRSSREYFLEQVEAARSGTPQIFEWYGRKRDGTPVITEVTLTTFMLDDELFEQAISRDITQRKQMEAALVDLNKTLENRVAQRTEELEKACAELLQRNFQFRKLARKLTEAEEEERKRIARLLHDNVQQLLAAAKFKSGMLQSGLHTADLDEIGAQILAILDQALEVTRGLTMELAPPVLYGQGFVAAMRWLGQWMEENHKLKVAVHGSLPLTPMPTEISNLLFRAIRELLFNVSKHSGVQEASVSIAMVEQGIRVTVADQGVGFDVADVLQTRSYGLLSIQEQLILLNGRLDISSIPGVGTTSTLIIPMVMTTPGYPEVLLAADDPPTLHTTTQPQLHHHIRILVADDHAMARTALVQFLGSVDDFEVVGEAVDGLDAVDKATRLRPDVILMDVSMPRLDGIEATRRITAQIPDARIIGLSMHPCEDMQPQMMAAGATSYLQKLIRSEELFATIRSVMQARKAAEA
jgi:PAS domain S-box-containing protein